MLLLELKFDFTTRLLKTTRSCGVKEHDLWMCIKNRKGTIAKKYDVGFIEKYLIIRRL